MSRVKYIGLDAPDEGTVYSPLTPNSLARFIVLRTDADPATTVGEARQAVRALDPNAPLSNIATVDELVAQSLERPQSLSLLIAGFAAVALLLSVIGIYGVMAYYVQQHLKDISIRLALGGSAPKVLRLIVGQGMRVVIIGVIVGLVTAWLSTRFMTSLLFGVAAVDVATFASVCAIMLSVALIACLVPALRATTLQPAAVLRSDRGLDSD